MAQNNKEILNYYNMIYPLIEDYQKVWKVPPVQLANYFKNGKVENFIKRNNLSDVLNIKEIINDIIDDIILNDNIMKNKLESETTEVNENLELDGSITHPDINNITILGDFFNTSIGLIVSLGENKYEVTVLGKPKMQCYIYTLTDIENIKNQIVNDSYNQIEKVITSTLHNVSFDIENFKFSFNVFDYFNFDLLKEKLNKMTPNETVEFMKKKMNVIYLGKHTADKNYHIFKINDTTTEYE